MKNIKLGTENTQPQVDSSLDATEEIRELKIRNRNRPQ